MGHNLGIVARLLAAVWLLVHAATASADYRETGGSVRLEAENYHYFVSQGGHAWQTNCSSGVLGFLGDAAVAPLPEDEVRNDFGNPPDPSKNPLTNSPRLDYVVNFATTGDYFVWVRGWGPGPEGPDGFSNSIHLGIDYDLANGSGTAPLSRVTFYNSPTPQYRWSLLRVEPDIDPTEPPKPVHIATPGDHVVSVWMRESGTYIDQILLTTVDPGFNVSTGTYTFDPSYGQHSDSVDAAATGVSLPLAATPSIAPGGGTVPPATNVSFDTCTGKQTAAEAVIYYTTDGATPTLESGTPVLPGVTVPALVSTDMTVKAVTTATSYWNSEVASAAFFVDSAAAYFSATFNAGADGFAYSDDGFRDTNQPAYASGVLDTAGGYQQGGLRVNVGGVDNTTVSAMSGGWSRAFSLITAEEVTVRLRYRLRLEGTYEQEECGQALLAIDGVLHGTSSGQDYLVQLCGTTPQSNIVGDTGWQETTLKVTLAAGAHTLRIGGYNNQKTRANEFITVYFDDVELAGPATVAVPPSSV